ncbi:uncharacterized protein N7511_005713 [Penicillium nucicola]|uniref:uncharacterized protein n=1 Tax=Penicillium nucicola TaxID=1850975 RepID=UPI002544EC78|nr:uncharacterized protein N7511_005713 [Penicillium nucicola]KAJ5762331.1 hypothetical protein N7511_005713 [Penicillium nucicola]
MTANSSATINYWQWKEPGGNNSLPGSTQSSLPGDENLPVPQRLNRTDLLQYDFFGKPGIHVIFMPKVDEEILKLPGSTELCRQLSEKFFLPGFFFERLGWNANGMFGSTEDISQNDSDASYGEIHFANTKPYEGTVSRFLSKKIKEKHSGLMPNLKDSHQANSESIFAPEYDYDWHYMAFCTLWRASSVAPTEGSGQLRADQSTDQTNVLLCFDLDDDSTLRLRRLLHKADLRNWKNEPFLMLEFALSIVVDQFEEDLWSFQKPVRDIEKTRSGKLFQEKDTGSSDDNDSFKFLVERYTQLHELSRHVIHISETMDAASNSLSAIVRDHNMWTQSGIRSSAVTRRLSKALLLHQNMISNLNFRAKAFVSRMDNEIKCASNFVAVADSEISKGILQQTRNEGKDLSDTVALLTLLFLPGTFISGIFGMNFFTLEGDNNQPLQWRAHAKIWIFFACTIPITILGFVAFMLGLNFLDYIRNIQNYVRDQYRRRKVLDPETGSRKSRSSKRP